MNTIQRQSSMSNIMKQTENEVPCVRTGKIHKVGRTRNTELHTGESSVIDCKTAIITLFKEIKS